MSEQPAESVEPAEPAEPAESVELDVDEEKMEAWDEVKSDYQVDPDGEAVPNAMADAESPAVDTDADEG